MSNVSFVFDAPEHHRLLLDESKSEEVIFGGDEFTVSAERAAELLAQPSLRIREKSQTLDRLTRSELEGLASAAGVGHPEDFGTKADLIDAIENPETHEPPSEVQ